MRLTRRTALKVMAGTALAGGLTQPVAAAPRSYALEPKLSAPGIWMIEGSTDYFSDENGGAIVNCVLLDTNDGLVVVDTGPSLKYGEALKDIALQLNGRGVAAVINTHHHPDHFFGNQVFADIPIYALEKTGALAREEGDGFADNMYRLLGDWMRGTEPVAPNAAINSSTLTIGGRTLRTLPLTGHTQADLAVLDVDSGTLIAGDLAFLDRAPTTPHANLADWKASLAELTAQDAAAVIPGHGPLDKTSHSLKQTADYLEWLETTLQKAALDGLDMVEIMDVELPGEFASMGAMPQEFHRSISHLYPEIERARLPLGE